METLLVPPDLRERLGDDASDGLVMMFADAHKLAVASFERRLGEEIAAFRLDVTKQLADMRFELLKWSFLFWIGQVAALTALLSLLLPKAN